ncbi:GDSL family lipase [Segniliparus rotundus DSM 44985]|uniref:GDSL family lipase n=1 Tax=Segniliparus rotundus (strain ATCC BAA-972 / CDC 1076 / CIP 108378 / DSM 44985 / JCM 13578) TaxID=640132 RepID=D6Z844_SEGRD|nr:GDSL family lipase [Segniliparus rotundus DSM 44985]
MRTRALLSTSLSTLVALFALPAAGAGAEPERQPVRHYVALGDSYVSKPGVRGLDPDGPNCARTDENYPAAVAAALGLEPGNGFTDASCAGAKSGALAGEQLSVLGVVVPPQLDAVTEDTDLVTVTFGANDQDFMFKQVTTCLMIDLTDRDGCRKQGPEEQPLLSEQGFAGVRDNIHRDLRGAVDVIKSKAPNSRIALVGYPQAFVSGRECTASLPMTSGDAAWINERLQGINATMQQVAKETGTIYVDVYTPSTGHGICSTGPTWVSGFVTTNWLETEPMHLTPLGAQELGKIIAAKVRP